MAGLLVNILKCSGTTKEVRCVFLGAEGMGVLSILTTQIGSALIAKWSKALPLRGLTQDFCVGGLFCMSGVYF